jgi:L-alanine-DL-glutamate epimerase-like enolase superfamily enzyme
MTNITSVETFSTQNIAVVRVRLEDGLEGYGQVAPYNADITSSIVHRQMARHVLGKDPSDIDALVERCVIAEHKVPRLVYLPRVGGIDTALWDLKGKREGRSVSELLGGTKARLGCLRLEHAAGHHARGRSRAPDPPPAGKGLLAPSRSVSRTISATTSTAGRAGPKPIVPTVRKAVGDATELLCDANSGYTPKRAIEVGRYARGQ